MDIRFLPHNTHIESSESFRINDPQLRILSKQSYVFRSKTLDNIPWNTPGIYTVGGGRQIGKTTLLKQWMLQLLDNNVDGHNIFYFTGELIDDHHSLLRILQEQLAEMVSDQLRYLILDEVTYIRDWDKAIKFMADAGNLENVVLVLTGSDMSLIQEARMRFPGRRGPADKVNYHIFPLSFHEVLDLKKCIPDLEQWKDPTTMVPQEVLQKLFVQFQSYLIHGGYLTAINELSRNQAISSSTLNTYADWVRGDMMKRGKQEEYLREILSAVMSRYCSQISWNSLAKDLSIDHPKTVADYIHNLSNMDALIVQSAIIEHKLVAAPKKAKKLFFADPFIYHALQNWLHPKLQPFEEQIQPVVLDPISSGKLAEACVVSHFSRYYPTYYIKAEGEVDIAYVDDNKVWPVEVKWTEQLRPKDLKQIKKYPNSRIFAKSNSINSVQSVATEPLPLALLRLDNNRIME